VTDMGGTVPRNFRLTMSPRYSALTGSLAFAGSASAYLNPADVHTYSITVAAGQFGRSDIYFDDTSINLSGADNIVTVINPDKVTVKAKDTGTNDISLDMDDFANLEFTAAGTYLVVVTNANTSAQGNYVLYLGPYPGQIPPDDVVAPCETIGDPSFSTSVTSP